MEFVLILLCALGVGLVAGIVATLLYTWYCLSKINL